jgi:hypothetical protein
VRTVNKFQGIVGEHFVFLEETNNVYVSIEAIKLFIKFWENSCKSADLKHLTADLRNIAIASLEAFSEGLILELDNSEHKLRQSVNEQQAAENN